MQFPSTILPFLEQLAKNNNKEWFTANRKEYERAKKDFAEFIAAWFVDLQLFDPEIEDQDPKKTIFRINRDVRFSKNKDPYKLNMGSNIAKGGKKSAYGGYYIHIQPGNSFLGAGIYGPEPNVLAKVRQEIDYNLEEFQGIVESKAFKQKFSLEGDPVKTTPKGYSKDNPAIEYIRNRHFHAFGALSDEEVQRLTTKKLMALLEPTKPLVQFLNRAIAEVMAKG